MSSTASSLDSWKLIFLCLIVGVVLREAVTRFRPMSSHKARDPLASSSHTAVAQRRGGSSVVDNGTVDTSNSLSSGPMLDGEVSGGITTSSSSSSSLSHEVMEWFERVLRLDDDKRRQPSVRDYATSNTSTCPLWAGKTDAVVRAARHVVLYDNVLLFESVAKDHVRLLSTAVPSTRLPFPHICPLDPKYAHLRRFVVKSRFHRYNGQLDVTYQKASFPQMTAPDAPYFVAALPNAVISTWDYLLLCDDDKSIGLHLSTCLRKGHLLHTKKFRITPPEPLVPLDGVMPHAPILVPLCGKGSCRWGGPFHFFVEHLARLAPLVDFINARNDTWVAAVGNPSEFSAMVYELLEMMGIPRTKVRSFPQGVHADYLLYTPADCFRPSWFSLAQVRHAMLRRIPASPAAAAAVRPLLVFSERIRGSGSWRTPMNYDTIKRVILSFCKLADIDTITVNDVSKPITIASVSRAAVVVGIHGANLAPVLFMNPGSSLVEMLARDLHPLCFYHVASMAGARYFPVFYDFPHFHDPPPEVSVVQVLYQVVQALNYTEAAFAALVVADQIAGRRFPLADSMISAALASSSNITFEVASFSLVPVVELKGRLQLKEGNWLCPSMDGMPLLVACKHREQSLFDVQFVNIYAKTLINISLVFVNLSSECRGEDGAVSAAARCRPVMVNTSLSASNLWRNASLRSLQRRG